MVVGLYRVTRRLGSVLVIDFMDFLCSLLLLLLIQCNIYVHRFTGYGFFPVINGMYSKAPS